MSYGTLLLRYDYDEDDEPVQKTKSIIHTCTLEGGDCQPTVPAVHFMPT